MPPTLDSRSALSRARLFLRLAEECSADKREEYEAFIEAAIVFARAAIHRLKAKHEKHPQWKSDWLNLDKEESVKFFRFERDHILKEAPQRIGQRIFVGGSGGSNFPCGPSKAEDFYFLNSVKPDQVATETVRLSLNDLEMKINEIDGRLS